MLEIFLLVLVLIFSSYLQSWWALLLILLLLAPSLYGMLTGAPFVPTPNKRVQTMLKLANLKPDELIYDLGCGDGRILLAAASQKAQAIGYEISPLTYLLAKIRTLLNKRIKVKFKSFWHEDLSKADVVFCFLMTDSMKTFATKIWPQLKPGTRVISHAFKLPDIKPEAAEEGILLYVKH